jgi:CO/xanthine dehydrogenase Mo-binding subunit
MQGGSELRVAAANAREALLKKGAETLKKSPSELMIKDGFVVAKNDASIKASYASLIGSGFQLKVDPKVKLKSYQDYQVVGKSIARVDIPEKVTGEFPYMHDFKLPGMVHARVIRSNSINAKLERVDDSEAKKVNGFLQTVRKNNFLAVVASSEWAAVKASRAIKATWSNGPDLPVKATVFEHWRKLPLAKEEATQKVGNAEPVLANSAKKLKASYNFAVQTHASIGPSCAVVDYKDGKLTAWSASQATHSMQHELSVITGLPKESIRLVYLDGSGCYGRNGHRRCDRRCSHHRYGDW